MLHHLIKSLTTLIMEIRPLPFCSQGMTPLTVFFSQERGSAFHLPDISIKDGYILVPEQFLVELEVIEGEG
jgi:hypothetical protein